MVELEKIGTEHSIIHREKFLNELKQKKSGNGVLLETCNRVEWYSGKGQISQEITKHLFRVVSGLDSSIIGETAIVGQVKEAYSLAKQHYLLDKNLHKLFRVCVPRVHYDVLSYDLHDDKWSFPLQYKQVQVWWGDKI